MEANDLIKNKNNKNKHDIAYIKKELNTLLIVQKNIKLFLYILLFVNIFLIFIIIKNKKENDFKITQGINEKFLEISKKIANINYIKNNNIEKEINKTINVTEIINQKIIDKYINEQNQFCDNFNKYINIEIEDQIKLTKFEFNKIYYQIYTYKEENEQKNTIIYNPIFKNIQFNNILNDIISYAEKNNILNNKDIYILDIGGYIGYLGTIFGNYGYSIISFEPYEKNYYIYRKNYCQFNRNTSVIIINKGIYDEDKKCNYYLSKNNNNGNGKIFCNHNISNEIKDEYEKVSEVSLTKLNNYIPYLSDKKLVLMIIDIQGSEEIAIESGIELILKYHIPYILLIFNNELLKEYGTQPENFIQKLINNGYNIYINGRLMKRIKLITTNNKSNIILYLKYE